MSYEAIFIVIFLLILLFGCAICWCECCTEVICNNDDKITIEPIVVNPVTEL